MNSTRKTVPVFLLCLLLLQLDALFRAIRFTQKKSDDVVYRAVLDSATLLRRHSGIHKELAKAMAEGQSVGDCILLIERNIASSAVV